MDIFRGRYRTSLAKAAPITANAALPYRFALPTTNHVFLPGHRIMVQVQSSWFPLYDRNPQIFVPNIMFAAPDSYRKATKRITLAGPDESFTDPHFAVNAAPSAPPLAGCLGNGGRETERAPLWERV